MTILAIIAALVIEQFRPLAIGRIDDLLARWSRWLEDRFNAGQRHHGLAAWLMGVALPTALMLVAQLLAFWSSALLALLLAVAVLYLTMGFRQFSHHYTAIHVALNAGEIGQARQLLYQWRGIEADRLGSSDVARLAIEEALVASHRHVFAPLILFALFGPAGAVLYRLARHFARAWGTDTGMAADSFGEFSRRTFAVIDWLPVRMTAASFAIVGNFEDAVFCWRTQASRWREEASGILLASGAGALGVRLGMPVGVDDRFGDRPELGVGEDADADFMQSAVGLVWRTLVMALLLLTLLGIASWAG
ncbi:MAG: CobD/CbiB family protein [Rhodocyclaceae bacterium]|nr:CobD/CbiB family protein [Rhodocyclaceae bacterium]